jgi:hypothetical protein
LHNVFNSEFVKQILSGILLKGLRKLQRGDAVSSKLYGFQKLGTHLHMVKYRRMKREEVTMSWI